MTSVRKGPCMVCVTEMNEKELPACARSLIEDGTIVKTSSISFDSFSHSVQDVLIMHKAEVPVFTQVGKTYATPKRVALVMEMLKVQEFCSYAHDFRVIKTDLFGLSEPGREA